MHKALSARFNCGKFHLSFWPELFYNKYIPQTIHSSEYEVTYLWHWIRKYSILN